MYEEVGAQTCKSLLLRKCTGRWDEGGVEPAGGEDGEEGKAQAGERSRGGRARPWENESTGPPPGAIRGERLRSSFEHVNVECDAGRDAREVHLIDRGAVGEGVPCGQDLSA
jgi:hypothetical protein